MRRFAAIEMILKNLSDNAVIATANGMIGRELHALGDRPGCFYMVGSMGLASSIGLGIAKIVNDIKVVILDGDGNIMMNLGMLPMIGALEPENVYHFVLDNSAYGSTGGQRTPAPKTRFNELALSSGYKRAIRIETDEGADDAILDMLSSVGPVLCCIAVEKGDMPECPRVALEPAQITKRLRSFLEQRTKVLNS